MTDFKPALAREYCFTGGRFPVIDGEPVPWLVSDDGPMVEQIRDGWRTMHILWLPVLIDSPLPRGRFLFRDRELRNYGIETSPSSLGGVDR